MDYMDWVKKLIPIRRNWKGKDYREKKKGGGGLREKRQQYFIKQAEKSICLPIAASHILSQPLTWALGLL